MAVCAFILLTTSAASCCDSPCSVIRSFTSTTMVRMETGPTTHSIRPKSFQTYRTHFLCVSLSWVLPWKSWKSRSWNYENFSTCEFLIFTVFTAKVRTNEEKVWRFHGFSRTNRRLEISWSQVPPWLPQSFTCGSSHGRSSNWLTKGQLWFPCGYSTDKSYPSTN